MIASHHKLILSVCSLIGPFIAVTQGQNVRETNGESKNGFEEWILHSVEATGDIFYGYPMV